MRYFFVPIFIAAVSFGEIAYAQIASNSPRLTVAQCIEGAARYHGVNQEVFTSILLVETPDLDPQTIATNSNGSVDRGIGGINSVHDKELQRYGVSPADMHKPCYSIYTAAWLLKRAVTRYGETWQGYASYHSATPYYNHRYQVLIHNNLVKRGVKPGSIMPVPALRPGKSNAR